MIVDLWNRFAQSFFKINKIPSINNQHFFVRIVAEVRTMPQLLYTGAHDRNRTGEPLPYQGSALPTELRGH